MAVPRAAIPPVSVRKANTDPKWFYLNHYDASDPFGSYAGGRDPRGPGHLGSDFNGMAAGTEVPAISNFVVVAVGFGSVIGNYVVLRVPDGYMFFYHLLSPSPLVVGESGTYGDFVGLLGSTGSASSGPHLHAGFSRTSGAPGTGAVEDPWPVIQAYIAAHSTNTLEEPDVRIFEDVGGQGAPNAGKGTLYVGSPGVWAKWTPMAYDRAILAQAFGPIIGQFTNDLEVTKKAYLMAAPPATLTAAQIDAIAKAIAAAIPGSDAKAIAAEVAKTLAPSFAAIPAAVIVEQKKPGN
jgi:hypothetical protein